VLAGLVNVLKCTDGTSKNDGSPARLPLAVCSGPRGRGFSLDPQRTWLEKAEHQRRRALTLDPALPEGHLARAWILWSPAKNFQHAMPSPRWNGFWQLDPILSGPITGCPRFVPISDGFKKEAGVAHEQAQRSNPKTRNLNLEVFYLYSGDFARAEEAGEAYIGERPGTKYALGFRPLPPLYSGDLDLAEQRVATALKQLGDEPLVVSMQGMLHVRRI
jgi:hypothetical protein